MARPSEDLLATLSRHENIMRLGFGSTFFLLVHVLWIVSPASGQEETSARKLVICGGGELPDRVFETFRELAGEEPKLVVIPTASEREVDLQSTQTLWKERGFDDVQVLHTEDSAAASTDEFVAPLLTASAVWFGGGSQKRIADAYLGTRVEKELHQLLERGGVIAGTSAGAAIQSRVMIFGGKVEPKISTGLGFVPEAIIDQHFLRRSRINRSIAAVRKHPDLIGVGISEGTALVVDNEKATVLGKSFVLRIQSIDGKIQIESFNEGETVPIGQAE